MSLSLWFGRIVRVHIHNCAMPLNAFLVKSEKNFAILEVYFFFPSLSLLLSCKAVHLNVLGWKQPVLFGWKHPIISWCLPDSPYAAYCCQSKHLVISLTAIQLSAHLLPASSTRWRSCWSLLRSSSKWEVGPHRSFKYFLYLEDQLNPDYV